MLSSSVCWASGRDQKLICCRESDGFSTCGNGGMKGNVYDKHVKEFGFACFLYNLNLRSF